MKVKPNLEASERLSNALKKPAAGTKMKETGTVAVGKIEYQALVAAAHGARKGLDCLTVTMSQAPVGRSLIPMLDAWFEDFETAMENYNSVAQHTIVKES